MSSESRLKKLMGLAAANQVVAKERRQNLEVSLADFEGVAQGEYLGITEKGSGRVLYKGKEYKTRMQGTTNIPAGTRVSLEFRKGYYVSYWS